MSKKFEASWESLDTRPLPSWYDQAKFGIFVHWGIFSVPAFGNEWFWYYWKGEKRPKYVKHMEKNYKPGFKYADFVPGFTAEHFNPDEWADLFEASGARYVVLTSKHHEGFTNWPSKVSYGWNSVDAGPGRDLVGDLCQAVRKKPRLKFGLYHSLYEWFHPLYLQDKENDFKTGDFVNAKVLPGLREIVTSYKPEVLWSDGDWEAPDSYWRSTEFLAWLYNDRFVWLSSPSPVKDTVVTNDRWGIGIPMKHGDFFNGQDRFNPGKLQDHKWENCMTIDKKSWGFRKNASLSEYLTIEEILRILVETVSCGGNLLMNVGPTAEGRIPPVYEERLRQVGAWLAVNGEAIYSSKPWRIQQDTVAKDVWYTSSTDDTAVYAILLTWPADDKLTMAAPRPGAKTTITVLGAPDMIQWADDGSSITTYMPKLSPSNVPCQWAWVLKMTNIGVNLNSLL